MDGARADMERDPVKGRNSLEFPRDILDDDASMRLRVGSAGLARPRTKVAMKG